MDRVRCFNILGLSENATKAQVERAYAKKLAMYKGPNYAEEPAYAERKIAQLRQAYEEAYALAESSREAYSAPRIEREAETKTKKLPTKKSQLFDAERDEEGTSNREKFHQWMERRDDEKQSRKDGKRKELPKLQKPDLTKLKQKLNEIKEEVASQLDLAEEENGDFLEQKPLAKEPEVEKDDFTDFVKDCVYTEEKPEPGRGFSGTASSFDEEEDDTYSNRHTGTPKESKGMSLDLIKLVVSVIVLVVAAIGGCVDDDIDFEDYEEEPATVYIYDIASEDIAEKDLKVADLAEKSLELLLDQEEYHMATIEPSDLRLESKADAFAKLYWEQDSLAAVTSYLFERYEEYHIDPTYTIEEQLDGIFTFYGFAELDTAEFYEQPYTGGRIESYCDYLDYLHQFYEAQ